MLKRKVLFVYALIPIFFFIFANILYSDTRSSSLPKYVKILFKGDDTKRNVSLVIRDGPYLTEEFLEILNKYNIKATFCLIGERVEQKPDIAKKIKEAGHEICTQLYHHTKASAYKSGNKLFEDVEKVKETVKKHLGVEATYVMPPYYDITTEYIYAVATNGAKYVILPNSHTRDWEETEEVIVNNIVNRTTNGDMILLHEVPSSVKALPKIIEKLTKKGFQFVSLNALIGKKEKVTKEETVEKTHSKGLEKVGKVTAKSKVKSKNEAKRS